MYNETLQDIFNEFYAREAKLEKDREKRDSAAEIERLHMDIEDKEDEIYDRNDTIEEMIFEINKAQKAYDDCIKMVTELEDAVEKLKKGPLKELEWHLEHAKIDW
jgi:ferritin-like metal-binding protein YciE